MITILSERHAALLFRRFREQQHMTREGFANRMRVSVGTIRHREFHTRGLHGNALIDTARAFGYAVALVPQRHPGARPTGTGWPE